MKFVSRQFALMLYAAGRALVTDVQRSIRCAAQFIIQTVKQMICETVALFLSFISNDSTSSVSHDFVGEVWDPTAEFGDAANLDFAVPVSITSFITTDATQSWQPAMSTTKRTEGLLVTVDKTSSTSTGFLQTQAAVNDPSSNETGSNSDSQLAKYCYRPVYMYIWWLLTCNVCCLPAIYYHAEGAVTHAMLRCQAESKYGPTNSSFSSLSSYVFWTQVYVVSGSATQVVKMLGLIQC